MKKTVLASLTIAMIAAFAVSAADTPDFAVWTLAETKAAEAKFSADPKDPNANPLITIMQFPSRDSVRRTSFGQSGEAEIHDNNTDVFCILTGQGEFVLGGKIVNAKVTAPGETRGPSIEGGTTKKVGVGDIVIIQPKVAHQIILTKGTRMSFMVAKMFE